MVSGSDGSVRAASATWLRYNRASKARAACGICASMRAAKGRMEIEVRRSRGGGSGGGPRRRFCRGDEAFRWRSFGSGHGGRAGGETLPQPSRGKDVMQLGVGNASWPRNTREGYDGQVRVREQGGGRSGKLLNPTAVAVASDAARSLHVAEAVDWRRWLASQARHTARAAG